MLRDALMLISAGEVTGVDDLAARLGLTPPLAGQLIADLTRLGYLATPGSACRSGCLSCPVAERCRGTGQLLLLTERGRRAAAAV